MPVVGLSTDSVQIKLDGGYVQNDALFATWHTPFTFDPCL